jgi:subfamily B ATP-binding cassette protein MsbA
VSATSGISNREKLEALYRVGVYRPVFTGGIILLSVFAALLEGIGLSFLIPVVEIAQGNIDSGEVSGIGQAFITTYEALGVPFTLEYVIAGVGIVMIGRYLSSFSVQWLQAALRTDYVRHLQKEGFENALLAQISYYDEHGSDEILNAIVTQSEYAGQTIEKVVRIIEQSVISLIYLTIALYLAPWLTILTGVVLGGFLYFLRNVLESGYTVGDRVARANERVQSVAQAGTQGVREVKLFGLVNDLFSEFQSAVNQFATSQIRLRRNEALIHNIYQMVTAITVFILIYVALTIASLSLASLGVFLFAMFRLAPRVSTLNNMIYQAEGKLPHLVRTQNFIHDLQAREEVDRGNQHPPSPVENVAFNGVEFSYESEPVLGGLSFTVERGEFVAFVGKSGAGKSTIVSLLSRMYEPDSGEITASGTPIEHFILPEWRERLAVVRQNPYIFNDTLRYNITLGNQEASQEEIRNVCDIAQVTEFLPTLPDGLDTKLGDDGVRLSGGQRQRIAIARALLKPADVLVLDEATSDLDTTLEREVHQGIEELSDYAMIVIAHRLSTVTGADRIYAMDDGQITESGTHNELLTQEGEYANLYSKQA